MEQKNIHILFVVIFLYFFADDTEFYMYFPLADTILIKWKKEEKTWPKQLVAFK